MRALVLWGVGLGCAFGEVESQPVTVTRSLVEPFLQKYCLECHGPEEQEGQVRFDVVDWEMGDNGSAQRWQDVLDQLNSGDMPPFEAEEFPSDDELAAVLDSLTTTVAEARRRLTDHGGEIKMRRLNRREYSATIRELFGFEVDLHDIPEDGEIVTFDTVGAEQFFSSVHFERYLELGRQVAESALRFNTRPRAKVERKRFEAEKGLVKRIRAEVEDKLRKKELLDEGKTWREAGFKDEGEMQILLRQWDNRVELPRLYLEYSHVETGAYSTTKTRFTTARVRTDIRGDYVIRVRGGLVEDPPELRKMIRVMVDRVPLGTLKMAGTPEEPQTVVFHARRPMGASLLNVQVQENTPNDNDTRNYIDRLGHEREFPDPRPSVWFDWVEVEGPFYPERRPLFEDLLFPEMPTGVRRSPYLEEGGNVREFITEFATLAFRRKEPEPSYLEALVGSYEESRQSGLSHRQALTEVMAVVLASPSFLFIQESAPAQESPHAPLSNRELAIRLSYFLWSAPPDEELYGADLSDAGVLARQVERMLADDRAKAFRDGFITQWAALERYDAITINYRQQYHFNSGLWVDAKREVREYFGVLLRENAPVRHLIDSDYVVVNGALANHYGLPYENTCDDSFQKVVLPEGSPRGGLLTQAAFLIAGSNGERSSPVIRGALILEKILHDKPSPPPPNVPELEEASKRPLSNRDLVLLHQKRPTCASCHRKMDVIGFGLENFDSIGRWRDFEKVGRREVAIEPGGQLPQGGSFETVGELKQLLLAHEDALAEELVESVLAYALGRTIEFSDGEEVEAILSKLEGRDYRLGDLVREVVLSPLFRRK